MPGESICEIPCGYQCNKPSSFMEFNFTGKRAVVTGGTAGIG